jgi:hypothetical protein
MGEASSVALERSAATMTSTLMAAQEEPPAMHMAASTVERTEERQSTEDDASVMRAVGVVQLDVTQPLRKETEVLKKRQTEGDTSVASLGVAAMVPCTASVLSLSTIGGGVVLVDRP